MLARTGQEISELRDRIYDITGRLYTLERSLPATPEMRIAVQRRLSGAPGGHAGRVAGSDHHEIDALRPEGAGRFFRHAIIGDDALRALDLAD